VNGVAMLRWRRPGNAIINIGGVLSRCTGDRRSDVQWGL